MIIILLAMLVIHGWDEGPLICKKVSKVDLNVFAVRKALRRKVGHA